MLLRLLKADLKYKPLINLILFLFIVLAMMSCASGVNNILTISTAQDDFYKKANVKDYYVLYYGDNQDKYLSDQFENFQDVNDFCYEEVILTSPKAIESATSKEYANDNAILMTNFEDSNTIYFNVDNQVCTKPKKGEIIVPQKLIDSGLFSLNETITFNAGEITLKLKVASTCKDALFGSESMGISRFLMNDEDYAILKNCDFGKENMESLFAFKTSNESSLTEQLSKVDRQVATSFSASLLKMVNYMDYFVAALLIVLSFCLVGMFTLILNYTIRFTLSREIRQIGILKAIGFADKNIQSLYVVKYLALTLIAGVIGFALSIPFGKLMLQSLSEKIVIDMANPWFVNALSDILMAILIVVCCHRCLKKINRISPLDAIRNSDSAIESKSSGKISLRKSGMKPNPFLSINELFREKRHYLTQALCISASLMMILIMVNTANTISNKKMFTLIGSHSSDVVISWSGTDGLDNLKDETSIVEKLLKENEAEATVFTDFYWYFHLEKNDHNLDCIVNQCYNLNASEFTYIEGSAPRNEHEIALTKITADKLGVEIGDTIKINIDNQTLDMLVCGYFQSLFNAGDGARLYEKLQIEQSPTGSFGISVDFSSAMTQKEIDEQISFLKQEFSDRKIYTATEFFDSYVGNVTQILSQLRGAVAGLMILLCALITLLLQLSIIDKEKNEIALMKVLGFTDFAIIRQYLLRVLILSIPAIIVAELLAGPVAKLTVGIAFRSLGLSEVEFFTDPVENILLWPSILLATTLFTVFITTLKTKNIASYQLGEIE